MALFQIHYGGVQRLNSETCVTVQLLLNPNIYNVLKFLNLYTKRFLRPQYERSSSLVAGWLSAPHSVIRWEMGLFIVYKALYTCTPYTIADFYLNGTKMQYPAQPPLSLQCAGVWRNKRREMSHNCVAPSNSWSAEVLRASLPPIWH